MPGDYPVFSMLLGRADEPNTKYRVPRFDRGELACMTVQALSEVGESGRDLTRASTEGDGKNETLAEKTGFSALFLSVPI